MDDKERKISLIRTVKGFCKKDHPLETSFDRIDFTCANCQKDWLPISHCCLDCDYDLCEVCLNLLFGGENLKKSEPKKGLKDRLKKVIYLSKVMSQVQKNKSKRSSKLVVNPQKEIDNFDPEVAIKKAITMFDEMLK